MDNVILVQQEGRSPLHVLVEDVLDVGRECDGLLVVDERVSRRHLQIRNEFGRLMVTDLGSSNGTFLDGERITAPVALLPNARIELGSTVITLHRVAVGRDTAVVPNPRDTIVTSADVVRPVRPAAGSEDIRRTSIENVAMNVASSDSFAIQQAMGADDTVTIMFSDIESSTELALSMGDHRWYEVLTWHNQLIEQRVAAHGGFIVKNQGDGFMVTFNSARRAIICASEVQQALHQHAVADPSSAIRVRIGLHTGEAIRQDSGDLFGRHVIIAARVGGLAEGAQILVSSIVREITSARGDLHFGEGELVDLKGVGQQTVYPVLWGAELPTA